MRCYRIVNFNRSVSVQTTKLCPKTMISTYYRTVGGLTMLKLQDIAVVKMSCLMINGTRSIYLPRKVLNFGLNCLFESSFACNMYSHALTLFLCERAMNTIGDDYA